MVEGVRVIRDRDYRLTIVSIMGDFRLKWFEKGTDVRYAGGRKDSKGRYAGAGSQSNYRGSINALGFFKKARTNEEKIAQVITDEIKKDIDKALR